MPIILRNKTSTIEIDKSVSLQHIVVKGSFDVTVLNKGDGLQLVILSFRKNAQIEDNIELDWREISEPEFTSAEDLRDTILAWNIPPVIVTESALPTGASTSEKQDEIITALEDISTKQDNLSNILKESKEIAETETELDVADLLLKAMDKQENMPFYVKLPKDLKQEPDGGLLIADMKGPIIWNSWAVANAPIIIDCTGYQSVLVHKTTAGIVTPTVSNDGVNFVAALVAPVSTAISAATMPTAVNIYVLPVVSKYLKLTGPASAVTCIIYLSQTPYKAITSPQSVNMAQVAGTAVPASSLAGSQVVGGPVASGVAATTYPLTIAGVDNLKVPLTRTILTDSLGKQIIATHTGQIPGTTQSNNPLNPLGWLSTYQNILAVQEMGRNEEGNTETDILTQILFELKILNQQIFELPRLIDAGLSSNDEPKQFREGTNNVFE